MQKKITLNNTINIGISEQILIFDKEYLYKNIDSNKINFQIKKFLIDLKASKYPYKNNLLSTSILKRPRLFYLLNNIDSLRKNYETLIPINQFVAFLFITKDVNVKRIDFEILQNGYSPNYKKTINDFVQTFSKCTISDENYHIDYTTEVIKLFVILHGQAQADFFLVSNEYGISHRCIDDNEKIFISTISNIKKIIDAQHLTLIEDFEKFWLCEFEKNRADIYLRQKEYLAALNHLFTAIKINPFHPLTNYIDYKEEFTKKYGADFTLFLGELKKRLGEDEEFSKTFQHQHLNEVSKDLTDNMSFPDMASFDILINHIRHEANDKKIDAEIVRKINSDFCLSPIREIIRSEVLKYAPKGTSKYDGIYAERIPEIIANMRSVIQADLNFPIYTTKLGTMIMIDAMNEKNKAISKKKLEEAFEIMNKGFHEYSRLGLKIRNTETKK